MRPSSPPVPCNALKTTSGRMSCSASTKRASKSSDCASCPSVASARITPLPLSIETSRSALGPPITTATFNLANEFSDEMDFELQIGSELVTDRAANPGEQRGHVEGFGVGDVDDEVSVER